MKISYGITVCNELIEIQTLLNFLKENKRPNDEIVVLFDSENGSLEVLSFLKLMEGPNCYVHSAKFNNDFAEWKNMLSEFCSGDYIFQIDADEVPNKYLIQMIPAIIQNNPKNEVYLIPRINTVKGLTQEHIQKWGWLVNSKGWVNFPDFQTRLWKKDVRIRWVGKVHERLSNYRTFSNLPSDEIYCLYHPKEIERQERQNSYYEKF